MLGMEMITSAIQTLMRLKKTIICGNQTMIYFSHTMIRSNKTPTRRIETIIA
jgi:hypothetical protein